MVSVLHSFARLTDVDGGTFSVPGTVLGSQQSVKQKTSLSSGAYVPRKGERKYMYQLQERVKREIQKGFVRR